MSMLGPLLSALLLISPLASARPVDYKIVAQDTDINMSWRAFGGMQSSADIKGVTGRIKLDQSNEFNDKINVSIPVSPLIASNSLLTWQLKSDMFFDAAHYPIMVFISDRVVDLGNHHYRIFGSLTVKNIRQPVILEAVLEASKENEWALHATTAISRSAFNMTSFAALVDDRIAIAITLQAAPL